MAGKRDGLYKRGRYWWARTDPITGRPCSTKCSSLKSARLWLEYRESLRADPRFAAAEEATIGHWAERVIESKRAGNASEETLEVYQQKLKNFRRLLGDATKLSKLTADVIDHYIETRRTEGVTDHTISKELTCVWQMLKLAKRSRCFPYDIEELKPVELKTGYEPRERALKREEVKALLTELSPGRAAFVCVTVGLGLRLSEARRLLPSDVDLVKGTVFVRGTKTKGARRHIPILSIFRSLVENAVPYLPLEGTIKNNLRRELLKACKRAGIEAASPNDFRRTCCTLMYEGGVDRDVARRILGHSSTAMVDKIYGKPTPEALGALAERSLGGSAEPVLLHVRNSQTEKSSNPGATLGTRTPDLRFTKPKALLAKTTGKQEKSVTSGDELSRNEPRIAGGRTDTLHSDAEASDESDDLPPASDHDPFQPATRPNLARAAHRLDVLCSELELGIIESRVADVAAGGANA